MIIVRVSNCTFKGNKNQSASFFFSEIDLGMKEENITEQWVLDNIKLISGEIRKQENTKIEIEKI